MCGDVAPTKEEITRVQSYLAAEASKENFVAKIPAKSPANLSKESPCNPLLEERVYATSHSEAMSQAALMMNGTAPFSQHPIAMSTDSAPTFRDILNVQSKLTEDNLNTKPPANSSGKLSTKYACKRKTPSDISTKSTETTKKSGTFIINGMGFTAHHYNKNSTSARCMCHRASGCKAQQKLNHLTGQWTYNGAPHTAKCYVKNGLPIPESMLLKAGSTHDFTQQMIEFVDEESLKNLAKLPRKIWERTVAKFSEIDKCFRGLTKQQVISRVYNNRRENCGGDAIAKLESEQLGNKKSAFLRYSTAFADEDGAQRVIMFSDPELLDHAKYSKVSTFCRQI